MSKKTNNIDLADIDLDASKKRFMVLTIEEDLVEHPLWREQVAIYLNDLKSLMDTREQLEEATTATARMTLRREVRQYSSAITKDLSELAKLLKTILYERRVRLLIHMKRIYFTTLNN